MNKTRSTIISEKPKQRASRAFDLEERLVDFVVRILNLVEALPNTKAGNHVAGQLLRSGTSPAPNYGEAQSAESRNDFLHKIKIALKELRETLIWLKVIQRKQMLAEVQMREIVGECDELIAIFVASVKTAENNQPARPGRPKSALPKSAINNQHSTLHSNFATRTSRPAR